MQYTKHFTFFRRSLFFVTFLLIFLTFLLSSCAPVQYSTYEDFIDPETGVHYLVIDLPGKDNCGLAPRYNSDGTLMIDPILPGGPSEENVVK